ncbi:hypothetical protein AX16_008571 [Volvariella volvacea WC 439]|nr:hypothetical protein AX16_008571 [Volvariella volvacea WC 439]
MANSEYQLQLRTLHNELAPIHRLPSEVLQSIMLAVTFAIIEQSKLMKVAVWGDQWWKRGVLVCSHVCRLWRETALAYPGLWTGIFIPPPDLDLLKEILRRSSRQPILMLNITRYTHERKFDRLDNWGDHRDDIEDAMDELHNAAYMSAIGEILQNQLHRVRCLRFVVNSIPWLDFLKWLNSPAPLLEELYIKGGADEMRTIIPHPTWFGSNTHKNPTPVLQRLYLKYCSPSFDFFFTCASLRELHIIHPTGWIPTRDFMPALLSLPQLEVLRLKWALEPVETPLPDDHPDLGEGDTYFPALRALFIQGNDSLTILHFLLPLHLPPSFHLRLLPHLQSTTPLEQPYDSESESESEFNNFTNDPSHEEGLFLTLLEQLSLFSNNHLEMDSSLYSPETKFNLRVRCIEEFNFHRKPGKLEYSYLYSYSFTPLIPSTTYIDYSDYDKHLPWFEFGFTSPDLSSTPHCDFTMDLVSSSNVVQWSFSGRAYEETGLFISNLPDLQSLETISVDGCGERVFNRLGFSVPKCDAHRKVDSYAENAGDESDLDWQGNSDVIKSLKAMTLAQVLEEFDPVERCNVSR